MSRIVQIANDLKKFNLKAETRKTAKANDQKLTDLNRAQMREGKNQFGDMRDYGAEWYAELKRQLPTYLAPYPKVDLFYTGRFQRAMFLQVQGDFFTFWSRDNKTRDIVEREGIEIFELNPEYMDEARQIVEPDLMRKISMIFQK